MVVPELTTAAVHWLRQTTFVILCGAALAEAPKFVNQLQKMEVSCPAVPIPMHSHPRAHSQMPVSFLTCYTTEREGGALLRWNLTVCAMGPSQAGRLMLLRAMDIRLETDRFTPHLRLSPDETARLAEGKAKGKESTLCCP